MKLARMDVARLVLALALVVLAWTGVKDTGRGAALSPIGFEMLTRPKSFHLRQSTK